MLFSFYPELADKTGAILHLPPMYSGPKNTDALLRSREI